MSRTTQISLNVRKKCRELNNFRMSSSHAFSVSLSSLLSVSLLSRGEFELVLSSSSCSSPALGNPLLTVEVFTHVASFGEWFLAASHPSLPLCPECHFKCTIHTDVVWLQIFHCAPRNHSWNWVCPLGCFHTICYNGPHAVQNEQCFFFCEKIHLGAFP